jgi:hypothetical protein
LTDTMAASAAINARTVVAAYSYSVMVMAGSYRWIPRSFPIRERRYSSVQVKRKPRRGSPVRAAIS